MKLLSVLTLCLLLSLDCTALAEARPASHSGTSSSYKSGFSSQKSNSASRAPSTPRSSPGAFGRGATAPPAPPPASRGKSALARDMEQSTARDNARRTLEQRRDQAAAARPLPPLNDTLAMPRQQQPQPQQQQPSYGQSGYGQAAYGPQRGAAPPPAYYPAPAPAPQQNHGLMYGLMGFMLGRAMSPPVHQTVPSATAPSASQPASQQGESAGAASTTVDGMPSLQAAQVAAPPQASFGASVLRIFAWLVLLSVIGWLAYYSVRKYRRLKNGAASGRNYSFERN